MMNKIAGSVKRNGFPCLETIAARKLKDYYVDVLERKMQRHFQGRYERKLRNKAGHTAIQSRMDGQEQ